MSKEIAIIIPSRERPHKIKSLHEQWFQLTNDKIHTDCHIVLDSDNENTYERLPGFIYHIVDTNGKRGVVIPLNIVANRIVDQYKYIGFIGDDHIPRTNDWNLKMYNKLEENGKFAMVYGNDLYQQEKLCTHIIMDAEYIKQLKYFSHPLFSHLYCDTLWMYMGKRKNNIHYLPDVIIEHLHFTVQKSAVDNMYRVNNSSSQISSSKKTYEQLINSEQYVRSIDDLC